MNDADPNKPFRQVDQTWMLSTVLTDLVAENDAFWKFFGGMLQHHGQDELLHLSGISPDIFQQMIVDWESQH